MVALLTFCIDLTSQSDTLLSNGPEWTKGDIYVGVSFRLAGNRGLGFHTYSSVAPEFQVIYFLNGHLAVGVNGRIALDDSPFLSRSLFDLSAQARHMIGKKRRRTFLEFRLGKGLVFTNWKEPLMGERAQHSNMFAFGLGRNQPVLKGDRLRLEMELLYEFRKPDRGSWFDSFKLDVGIKYRINRRLVYHEN